MPAPPYPTGAEGVRSSSDCLSQHVSGPHPGTAALMAGVAPTWAQPAPAPGSHPFKVQVSLSDRHGPAPIARFAMDPDTIGLLERYDPGILAMTDLLRHQIDFTQHFMEGQKRLAKASGAERSRSGFKYTTLKATKEYIAARNPHHVMSLEEALKQVGREEDCNFFWKDDAAYT